VCRPEAIPIMAGLVIGPRATGPEPPNLWRKQYGDWDRGGDDPPSKSPPSLLAEHIKPHHITEDPDFAHPRMVSEALYGSDED